MKIARNAIQLNKDISRSLRRDSFSKLYNRKKYINSDLFYKSL